MSELPLSAALGRFLTLGPRRGTLYPVSKRDYGQTSSALLASQQHKFEAELRKCRDKNFELNDRLGREQALRGRLEGFLEEKGLLDQWQEGS